MDTLNSSSRPIREYQDTDLNALLTAWEKAFRLAHPFMNDEFIAKVRTDIPTLYIPNTETLVCEQAGKVMGFISLMGNEIAALFVDPDWHGKGHGRGLVDKACTMREGDLTVEVFKANPIGRKFYQAYGFEYVSEYIFEGVDEIVLKLKFSRSS